MPHISPIEAEPQYPVYDAVTDPSLDDRLGFSIGDANPELTDDTSVEILEREFAEYRPIVDTELQPIIAMARDEYLDTVASAPALAASLERWSFAYHLQRNSKDLSANLFHAVAIEGPERFFAKTLDELDIRESEKIMIAHVTAVMNHPGAKWAGPTPSDAFEAATAFLGKKVDRNAEDIEHYRGSHENRNGFADYVVETTTNHLANTAIESLALLGEPDASEKLKELQDHFSHAFDTDIAELLKTVQLDWEILPDAMLGEEGIAAAERIAHENGWTFDLERFKFLQELCRAVGGSLHRSEILSIDTGFYFAAVLYDEDGKYAVVADNPFNPEKQDTAVYIAAEDKVQETTGRNHSWKAVLAQDRPTARARGAVYRLHTLNYKSNVISTLPSDLRANMRHIV